MTQSEDRSLNQDQVPGRHCLAPRNERRFTARCLGVQAVAEGWLSGQAISGTSTVQARRLAVPLEPLHFVGRCDAFSSRVLRRRPLIVLGMLLSQVPNSIEGHGDAQQTPPRTEPPLSERPAGQHRITLRTIISVPSCPHIYSRPPFKGSHRRGGCDFTVHFENSVPHDRKVPAFRSSPRISCCLVSCARSTSLVSRSHRRGRGALRFLPAGA
jgi:hypothetical protein